MREFFSRERVACYCFLLVLSLMMSYSNSFRDETDFSAFIIMLALFIFALLSAGLMIASNRTENERLWSFSVAAYAASLTALAMILLVFTASGAIVLVGAIVLHVCITLFFTGAGLFLAVLTD